MGVVDLCLLEIPVNRQVAVCNKDDAEFPFPLDSQQRELSTTKEAKVQSVRRHTAVSQHTLLLLSKQENLAISVDFRTASPAAPNTSP